MAADGVTSRQAAPLPDLDHLILRQRAAAYAVELDDLIAGPPDSGLLPAAGTEPPGHALAHVVPRSPGARAVP